MPKPPTGNPTVQLAIFGDSPTITISTYFSYVFYDVSDPNFYPDLKPGNTFVDLEFADSYNHDGFSIVAPGVPEPSTWAMMLIGFLAIGFFAKRPPAQFRTSASYFAGGQGSHNA